MDRSLARIQQAGSVLLWVMFLLFIVSSSALVIGKQGRAQLTLVGYYDEHYQKARAFRLVERQVKRFLDAQSASSIGDSCLAISGGVQSCWVPEVDTSLWRISARKLMPYELESFVVAENVSCDEDMSDYWIALTVDSLVFSAQKRAIFRVCHHKGVEESKLLVRRELWWSVL